MAFSRFCLAVIVLFCSTSTLRAVNGLSLQIPQHQMHQVLPLGTNATVQCLHQSNETRPNISWTIDNSLPYDTYMTYFNENGIKVAMDSDNISYVSVEGRQENVVPGGRRFSCNAVNPVSNVPVASETAAIIFSECLVSEPTISLSDVCAVLSQESLTYSCNGNGVLVRWSSSLWTGDITATPGGNPGIQPLTVSGVTLMENDNGNSSCLVSNLTFSGTLSALEALNGATLSCDAPGQQVDSKAIVIPTLPGISSLMDVSSLSCDGDSNMAVTLQWTPPTNTGGQGVMITHYVLTGLPQSASCSTGPCDNITSTTTTITGLQCNTSYSVSVRAVNCRGIGPSSNTIEIIIYPAPTTQVSLISSSSVLSSLSLTKMSYTQLPTVSSTVVAQQEDCSQLAVAVGVGVGIPFLLIAIISSLITLIITCQLIMKRQKFNPKEPVYADITRNTSDVKMEPNVAYSSPNGKIKIKQ